MVREGPKLRVRPGRVDHVSVIRTYIHQIHTLPRPDDASPDRSSEHPATCSSNYHHREVSEHTHLLLVQSGCKCKLSAHLSHGTHIPHPKFPVLVWSGQVTLTDTPLQPWSAETYDLHDHAMHVLSYCRAVLLHVFTLPSRSTLSAACALATTSLPSQSITDYPIFATIKTGTSQRESR